MIRLIESGNKIEFESGLTLYEIAKSLYPEKASSFTSAKVNGDIKDLRDQVEDDSNIEFLSFADEGGSHAFWHTSSHVMAQALKRLFPSAKLAIGPAIANGFYYDFDMEETLTPEVLEKIELEMKKVINENPKIERFSIERNEAIDKTIKMNEPYKTELISDIANNQDITFYNQGEFSDLCAGPHLMNLSPIQSFKLLNIAGAYWRGNENNKMLQRIYAISFPTSKELEDYLNLLEEAKKRDHRKLGREMDLFSIQEEGPGFPFFHPKGIVVRNELESYWRAEHKKRGYDEIRTPIILDAEMWRRSGHWDHYKDNMYFTEIDNREFAIKPMNCPGAMLLYKRAIHSYRELPIRYAEMGLVHRHEKSGALHGLMRVRNFTQDDAHIFITEDMIQDEVISIIDFIAEVYELFGFKYHVELSTRPEESIGTQEQWDKATQALQSALDKKNLPVKINEGDGAFYGPKIDFHLQDSIGRSWQCGTIQLDFQMPERFDLNYIGNDGSKHRPCVIHRVIFGSVERFFAILLEHYAGDFPLWLAPVQASIIVINDEYLEYSNKIYKLLDEAGIRVELDSRNEKLGYKIREAETLKIPYMLVIGKNEANDETVSLRSKKLGNIGPRKIDEVIALLQAEIQSKAF